MAGSTLPKVIKNFNLILNGTGFAGKVDEVTLPTLSIKADEHRAGGLDTTVQIDLGMEKLEIKGKVHEHHPVFFQLFGLQNGNAVGGVFRAAKSDDTVVEPYIVTFRGAFKELPKEVIKAGEKTPLNFSVHLRYYKLEMNGVTLIEIDVDNCVRIINGVDQLAAIRAAINI
jgi:P2 family phage contractile tail tube protein